MKATNTDTIYQLVSVFIDESVTKIPFHKINIQQGVQNVHLEIFSAIFHRVVVHIFQTRNYIFHSKIITIKVKFQSIKDVPKFYVYPLKNIEVLQLFWTPCTDTKI